MKTWRLLAIGTIVVLSFMLCALPAHARLIRVPEQFPTINAAINAENGAAFADVILVAPGVYDEEVINLPEGVSLMGSGREKTVVHGRIQMLDDPDTAERHGGWRLEDITFVSDQYHILHIRGNNAQVRNCTFELYGDNPVLADVSGKKILLQGNEFVNSSGHPEGVVAIVVGFQEATSDLTLFRNMIYARYMAEPGQDQLLAGVAFQGSVSDIFIENNVILGEGAGLPLYGIFFDDVFEPDMAPLNVGVKNNTIVLKGEVIDFGAGIRAVDISNLKAQNNIIAFGGEIDPDLAWPVILAGIVNNVALSYNIYDGASEFLMADFPDSVFQEHNIQANPAFVNPQERDFHLLLDSSAIDAGHPEDPYLREPEPNGDRINCGAYGNTKEAAITVDNVAVIPTGSILRHVDSQTAIIVVDEYVINIPLSIPEGDNVRIFWYSRNHSEEITLNELAYLLEEARGRKRKVETCVFELVIEETHEGWVLVSDNMGFRVKSEVTIPVRPAIP